MKKIVFTLFVVLLVVSSSFIMPLTANKASAAPIIQPGQTAEQIADGIIKTGLNLRGKATYSRTEYKTTYPYKFSCATFIDYIFKQNGVDLATYNEDYMLKLGWPVGKDQMQKGDLFYFDVIKTDSNPADHVGVYMGNNKLLHMADPQQNIIISDMTAKPYYTENFVGARRVIPNYLPSNPPTRADKIINLAYTKMGNVWISSTVNDPAKSTFTHAGFINYIFSQNGITLGTPYVSQLAKKGTFVAKGNLQKGDLVFYSTRIGGPPTIVAVYAGNYRILHTDPTKGIVSRLVMLPWYSTHYYTARRVM
ncbi:C40 family peptidase [Bacillus sp. MRMR6]|uniref:C40 family peptidase n=1 Tax=Bacillus sp. MRMR6 TaxID=1928617 RepID=UPI00095218C2|nr:NlpC/P60 family protein [Bacillus sp. MRMR6]OLS40442.1 hypothetical protein BTR25_09830 [Bacillus sp. MRMR6]